MTRLPDRAAFGLRRARCKKLDPGSRQAGLAICHSGLARWGNSGGTGEFHPSNHQHRPGGGETLHNVRLLDAYGPQPEAQPR